jgi:hypothetical protein
MGNFVSMLPFLKLWHGVKYDRRDNFRQNILFKLCFIVLLYSDYNLYFSGNMESVNKARARLGRREALRLVPT